MTETMTPPLAVDESTTRSRKPLFVAGGAAAVLALAGGAYFLLGGGGGSSAAPAPVVHGTPHVLKTVTHAKAAKPAAATKAAVLPAVSTVALGRDPFLALYIQPVASTASTTGTSTAPTSTTPTSTTPTSTTPTSTTGTTSGTAPATTASYPLRLASIARATNGTHFYTFSYAGKPKKVVAAQRFGAYGELIVLGYATDKSGKVVGAVIQVGDDEPLTVGLGEKVTVK